jgi:peptidoglycan/LPS O-acetylase OafA/YrhL
MEEKEPDISQERSFAAERFSEYAIGITLLLKSWEDAPHFHHFPLRVIFIFLAGLFIIIGTKFHNQLAEKAKSLPGVFHLLEGLAEIIAASIFFEEGKRWSPPFFALIGFYFCSLGLVVLLAKEGKREKAFCRLRIFQGIAFIVFAVALAVANALIQPKPVVMICSALLVFVGMSLILRRNAPLRKRISLTFKAYEYLHRKKNGGRSVS